ncbi:MAG: hypothetical protein KJS64_05600 [Acidobacteria bacterium]|nr:hypothetical protein [Acidobacteriota bacterium]
MDDVLPSWFVFVGAAFSVGGAFGYIRDVLRGETAPNRVTWILWAAAPLLAFVIEVQEGAGLASVMTLVIGLVPIAVLLASTRNPQSVWKLGPFDVTCGVISIFGLIIWLASSQPTIGLIAQVAADSVAALPTLRKAWVNPSSESAVVFYAGAANGGITLLTLDRWTTAGALFPLAIFLVDVVIGVVVSFELGKKRTK